MSGTPARTADTRVIVEGVAHLTLPTGCEVAIRLRPDQSASPKVRTRLEGSELKKLPLRIAESGSQAVPFQCVFDCDDDFYGATGATIEALCLQTETIRDTAPVKVEYVRASLKAEPGGLFNIQRGKPVRIAAGNLKVTSDEIPLAVSLEWKPAGAWPVKAELAETRIKLEKPTSPASVLVTAGAWPKLGERGNWKGTVVVQYGRGQKAEIPVEASLGPLLSSASPKAIVNEPGGVVNTALSLTHSSDEPVDIHVTVGRVAGQGKVKGKTISLISRVKVGVNGNEANATASEINRPDPQGKRRQWSVRPGDAMRVELQFDLRAQTLGDIVEDVAPGKYRGSIKFEVEGAPSEEAIEVPIELVLGE